MACCNTSKERDTRESIKSAYSKIDECFGTYYKVSTCWLLGTDAKKNKDTDIIDLYNDLDKIYEDNQLSTLEVEDFNRLLLKLRVEINHASIILNKNTFSSTAAAVVIASSVALAVEYKLLVALALVFVLLFTYNAIRVERNMNHNFKKAKFFQETHDYLESKYKDKPTVPDSPT